MQLSIIYVVSNHQTEENKHVMHIVEKRNHTIRTLAAIYLKYGMEKSLYIHKE